MPVIGSISGKEIPSSVVVSATAASYTVPAGFYAIVKAQVRNGGTFSVNGTVVLTSNTWNSISSNSSPNTITGGGNSGTVMPTMSTANPSGTTTSYVTGTGIAQNPGNNGTAYTSSATFTNATAMTAIEQQFKVPTGTVVVGAGNASYSIELYSL